MESAPVFYGWVIAAVGALGLVMTSPGQTYSVSIFIEHFIQDLNISRSLVSSLYTAGTLLGALALPTIGRQIDQRGARTMMPLITTVSGVVWANYFGRKHLGSISGVARLAGTIGSALGPMPFGIIRDVMGSYNPLLTIVTIPTLALTVACFFVHKPEKA